ncbi:MAG: hypothetical protein FIB08_06665 [Candidatus Methanoperedens sp.]|nr:hypothetical protein [Candidatus Methanoperedens sp.]
MPLDHIDLKEMKKSGDIEGLLSVLDTGDPKDMGEAIRMLGELRSRKAIRSLVGLLERDNIQVRANSAWALGEIGESKAVLPLIGLLNDPSDNVRVYAAWALGKIGDKRALNALNTALKNGSQDLRKHAREAIARIESNKLKGGDDDNGSMEEEPQSQEMAGLALVTLDVPLGLFECDYVSKVEGESRKGNTMRFSGDVSIEDTVNSSQENTRRIVLGLKKDFRGLVSIDVLFKYLDNDGGEKTSSVWLQMESVSGETYQEPVQEEEVQRRKASRQVFKKSRIKPARKVARPVEDEIPDNGEDEEPQSEEQPSFEVPVAPVAPVQEVPKKKGTSRRKPAPVEAEKSGQEQVPESRVTEPHEAVIEEPQSPPVQEIKPETVPQPQAVEQPQTVVQPKQEVKPESIQQQAVEKPQVIATPKQETKPEGAPQPQVAVPTKQEAKPEEASQPHATEKPQVAAPPIQEAKPETVPQPQAVQPKQEVKPEAMPQAGVDSAVRLLSDIGMSGMTEAASAVTQLGGQEADSLQSRLRTLPVDQIPDELTNLGEYIASVEVKLKGKGESGEMRGEMQMYFPKNVALDIANELLCNGPGTAVKDFTEDIISTLKETANIFGGQYVSAISEYIEIPIYLEAPAFKTGASAQVAESLMKDIAGKVEFVLATDLAFGNGKTGRLIMLLDPKSYDIIITKLF